MKVRSELTDRANEHAIGMFALNLKPLLLQPPIKGKGHARAGPCLSHGMQKLRLLMKRAKS